MRGRVLTFIAGLVLGSLGLMLLLRLLFRSFVLDLTAARLPLFSVLVSTLCVLLPAIVASYWPRGLAPGSAPQFLGGRWWQLVSLICLSGPIYLVSAALELALSGQFSAAVVPSGEVWLSEATWPLLLWAWFALAVLPAVSEEWLYRGVVQRALYQTFAPWAAIVLSSVLFALVHMDVSGLIPRLVLGVWFGFLYRESRGLGVAIYAHLLHNSWALLLATAGVALTAMTAAWWAVAFLVTLLGMVIFIWDWLQVQQAGEVLPVVSRDLAEPRFITVKVPDKES